MGYKNIMDLIYFKDPSGNFGDDLNEWVWDSLLPGWRSWDETVSLVGVGTLLNAERLDRLRDNRLLIAGSGVGYGDVPALPLPSVWDVRSVRGPQSARLLNFPDSKGLLDPAIMIPEFAEFRAIKTTGRPIFIPHHTSMGRHDWAEVCRNAGANFVSPSDDAKEVIRRIAAAPLVLAESMHAAILADSFRVPWIPVSISPWFNAAKWNDWGESLELTFAITPLFPQLDSIARFLRNRLRRQPSSKGTAAAGKGAGPSESQNTAMKPQYRNTARRRLEHLVVARRIRTILGQTPYLSDPAILADRKARYEKVLAGIRADYGRATAVRTSTQGSTGS